MVRAVLPTPPSPSTTSLYSVILPAMVPAMQESGEVAAVKQRTVAAVKQRAVGGGAGFWCGRARK
jgi:hypothetical protein